MKNRETAVFHPETDYGRMHPDFEVGDLVQLLPSCKRYSGQIGKIIGISFYKRTGQLMYTVKFSDTESIGVFSKTMRLLRKANDIECIDTTDESE